MEIKQAATLETAGTIRELKISDRVQLGIIVASMVCWVGYNELPSAVKAKVGSYAFMALSAGAFTTRLLNGSIRENRLEIGDLKETVTNYALLNSPESATRLKAVSNFIENGEIPTKDEITSQIAKLTQEIK